MGEAARRKDLVEDVRKKIGAEAAGAVDELQGLVKQLALEHRALAKEMEGFRHEVAMAKAAPAQVRAQCLQLGRTVDDHGEQLESLDARLTTLTRLCALLEVTVQRHDGELAECARLLAALTWFQNLTWRQRLRWLVSGRLPWKELNEEDAMPTGPGKPGMASPREFVPFRDRPDVEGLDLLRRK